ncbi:uncharacterized protein [Triticum aestivum]|uniref:uncharacterized protein isoform X2 n=1 Tax=Triticum aestivum TaxID=4565 RepID=UPI001ABC843B|nr:uncharacterized protein LOC109757752 isoform X2 [Aegilops tauschii subsp. strangulata]XP_044373795.1 uncharacterized protein LOC123096208 isoform X2 [Triticum aestivum]
MIGGVDAGWDTGMRAVKPSYQSAHVLEPHATPLSLRFSPPRSPAHGRRRSSFSSSLPCHQVTGPSTSPSFSSLSGGRRRRLDLDRVQVSEAGGWVNPGADPVARQHGAADPTRSRRRPRVLVVLCERERSEREPWEETEQRGGRDAAGRRLLRPLLLAVGRRAEPARPSSGRCRGACEERSRSPVVLSSSRRVQPATQPLSFAPCRGEARAPPHWRDGRGHVTNLKANRTATPLAKYFACLAKCKKTIAARQSIKRQRAEKEEKKRNLAEECEYSLLWNTIRREKKRL